MQEKTNSYLTRSKRAKSSISHTCNAEIRAAERVEVENSNPDFLPGGEYFWKVDQYAEAMFRSLYKGAQHGDPQLANATTLRKFADECLSWADSSRWGAGHLVERCRSLDKAAKLAR